MVGQLCLQGAAQARFGAGHGELHQAGGGCDLRSVACACRMLPGPNLELTMEGCRRLEVLDAQHSEVPCGAGARLHEACPALRTLLQTEPPRQPPARPIILDSPEPSESGSTCY